MTDTLDRLLSYGLTKFGDIQLQLRPPLVRAAHCRHALFYAKPGMVICRRFGFTLDGQFIPGVYSHSGIVDSAERYETDGKFNHAATVIHAVAEGVQRIDLLDFVKDADGFVLIDFKGLNALDQIQIIGNAQRMIGRPYDFHFSITDKGKCLYCHETTAGALAPVINIIPSLKKIGIETREIFTADNFLEHPRARIVYEAKVVKE